MDAVAERIASVEVDLRRIGEAAVRHDDNCAAVRWLDQLSVDKLLAIDLTVVAQDALWLGSDEDFVLACT